MLFFNNLINEIDILSYEKKLRIFKRKKYSSCWTLFWSIILILAGIGWAVLEIIAYFQFKNPKLFFEKYEEFERKDIKLRDMTQFNYISKELSESSSAQMVSFYAQYDFWDKKEHKYKQINYPMEQCKLGYNIDKKYKKIIEEQGEIEEMYCFNHELMDKTIDTENSDSIKIILLFNGTVKEDIIELNIHQPVAYINNTNRPSPISYKTSIEHAFGLGYNISLFRRLNYELIRYKSDDGYFFAKVNEYNGVYIKKFEKFESEELEDGQRQISISLLLDDKNINEYTRSYPRIQSTFANILTMFNIIKFILSIIVRLVNEQKMNNEIIKHVIERKQNDYKENYLHKDKKIKNNKINIFNLDLNDKNQLLIDKTNVELGQKVYKSSFEIFISAFSCCKKNKKNKKIIKLCNELIDEHLSVDNIITKLDLIENIYNVLPYEARENIDSSLPKKYSEIYNIITYDDNIINIKDFETILTEDGEEKENKDNEIRNEDHKELKCINDV